MVETCNAEAMDVKENDCKDFCKAAGCAAKGTLLTPLTPGVGGYACWTFGVIDLPQAFEAPHNSSRLVNSVPAATAKPVTWTTLLASPSGAVSGLKPLVLTVCNSFPASHSKRCKLFLVFKEALYTSL